jgi:hypothetical protein
VATYGRTILASITANPRARDGTKCALYAPASELRRRRECEAQPINAVEWLVGGDVAIVEEELVFTLPAFGLRSLLVRF